MQLDELVHLSDVTASRRGNRLPGPALADGSLGMCLFDANRNRIGAASERFRNVVRDASFRSASLVDGWAGALVALACIDEHRESYTGFRRDATAALTAHVERVASNARQDLLQHSEFLYGLAGISVALSLCATSMHECAMTNAIDRVLDDVRGVRLGELAAQGRLGVAHGVCGLLAALTFMTASPSRDERIARILEAYFDSEAQRTLADTIRMAGYEPLSWCHGLSGIVPVVISASRAVRNHAIAEAAAGALARLTLPPKNRLVERYASLSLCHGFASFVAAGTYVGICESRQDVVSATHDVAGVIGDNEWLLSSEAMPSGLLEGALGISLAVGALRRFAYGPWFAVLGFASPEEQQTRSCERSASLA